MAEDLLDKIGRARFLGREFLVWLWFESLASGGELAPLGELSFEIELEANIVLSLDKEQCRLKGRTPASGREAREALRQGKLPTHARLKLTRGDHEYGFQFMADGLALSAVRIPAQVKGERDEQHEQFYERMYLVEELEGMLDGLYSDFLALRLGPSWSEAILPFVQAWVREEDIDEPAYAKARGIALVKARKLLGKPAKDQARAPRAEKPSARV